MASREHYLQYGVWIVDWTIYFRSSLCYFDERLKLMNGRRSGPIADRTRSIVLSISVVLVVLATN